MKYVTKSMRLDEEVVAWLDKLKEFWGSYNKGLRKVAFNENRASAAIDITPEEVARPLLERTSLVPNNSTTLDATGPELSQGRGKASTETYRVPRGLREKGDSKR